MRSLCWELVPHYPLCQLVDFLYNMNPLVPDLFSQHIVNCRILDHTLGRKIASDQINIYVHVVDIEVIHNIRF